MILDLQLATHQKQISLSMAQAAKTAAKLSQTNQRTVNMHTTTMNTTAPAPSGNASASTSFVGFFALPKLTQAEKDLLNLHQGCYKWRTFYTGHFSRTCPNDRPTLDACKKVTAVHASHAKATFDAHTTPVVATVFGADIHEDFIYEDFVDSNEFDKYVKPSPACPLPDHLWWSCCIDAPFTCAPSPIQALIDHGASPVLISEETVELYGLVSHKLFKLFSISAALVSNRSKPDPVPLMHYCRLDLISPDAQWKSWTLNAIICPNLQTDIILGLDFLVKNKIVVDAELRMVISKDSGFDLMNPPKSSAPPPPSVSPAVRQRREARLIKESHVKIHKM
jgi:hypothetical protein